MQGVIYDLPAHLAFPVQSSRHSLPAAMHVNRMPTYQRPYVPYDPRSRFNRFPPTPSPSNTPSPDPAFVSSGRPIVASNHPFLPSIQRPSYAARSSSITNQPFATPRPLTHFPTAPSVATPSSRVQPLASVSLTPFPSTPSPVVPSPPPAPSSTSVVPVTNSDPVRVPATCSCICGRTLASARGLKTHQSAAAKRGAPCTAPAAGIQLYRQINTTDTSTAPVSDSLYGQITIFGTINTTDTSAAPATDSDRTCECGKQLKNKVGLAMHRRMALKKGVDCRALVPMTSLNTPSAPSVTLQRVVLSQESQPAASSTLALPSTECVPCERTFKTPRGLVMHQRKSHRLAIGGPGPSASTGAFPCNECTFAAKTLSGLKSHGRAHKRAGGSAAARPSVPSTPTTPAQTSSGPLFLPMPVPTRVPKEEGELQIKEETDTEA